MNRPLNILIGIAMLAGNMAAMAASIDITAQFSPSMENPENNTFINTTKQSGFCNTWPSLCSNGLLSIATGLRLDPNSSTIFVDDPDSRDHIYFKLPSKKTIEITNKDTGKKNQIIFSFQNISTKMWRVSNPSSGWAGGSFSYPVGGCSNASVAMAGGTWYTWVWRIKDPSNPTACYKKRKDSDANISNSYMNEISVGYAMETPSPLIMDSGNYTASITYSVGPGMDFDFGNKWDASDSELTINFNLTINHELKLTSTPDDQKVSLQPCRTGNVCSEEEGEANWERWMINRVTPQLTGRSNFNLSSSGSFTTYLECEHTIGLDCALISDNVPSQLIPVQALLSLPSNVVDYSTNSVVSKKPLKAGKDLTTNIFRSKSFGNNNKGSIDFLIKQQDVDTMLKTRPDTYRGAVTVIFDPNIY